MAKTNPLINNKFFDKIPHHAFIVSIFALSCLFFLSREFIYFRDYGIIFDGVTRILNGEVIYRDFGIPIGPIVFAIPALVLYLFEETFFYLQISQMIVNFFLIYSFYYLIKEITNNNFIILLSVFLYIVFFTLALSHPWYNNIAILFLNLSLLFAVRGKLIWHFAMCGIFTSATILSKQDVGLILAFALLIMIALSQFFDKKKNSLVPIIAFSFNIFFGIFLILSLFDFKQGLIWMTYSLIEGPSNIERLKLLFVPYIYAYPNPVFLISIGLIVSSLIYRLKKVFVLGLVFFISAFQSVLSGLFFSSFFVVGFIMPMLLLISRDQNLGRLKFIFLALSFFAIVPIIKTPVFLLENYYQDKPEYFFFNKRFLVNDTEFINLGTCSDSLENTYGSISICKLISDLKALRNNYLSDEISLLNLSELPFYKILSSKPPGNMPLWFDRRFLKKNHIDEIVDSIEKSEFDLIILQMPFANKEFYQLVRNRIKLNNSYFLGDDTYFSPTCYGVSEENNYSDGCKILIYYKD